MKLNELIDALIGRSPLGLRGLKLCYAGSVNILKIVAAHSGCVD